MKPTLGELFDRWVTYKYRYAPERTRADIRRAADLFILDKYSDMPVKRLDDIFAQEYVRDILARTMRHGDRHKAIGILRGLSDHAVKKKLIGYNPFAEIKLPAKQTVRHHALNEDDIRYIMSLDPAVLENVFFQIKLLTGTRTGECLGLCWNHVDFARKTIMVCDQLQYIEQEDGGRELGLCGHLKNYRPRMLMPPDITFELLQIRKETQCREREKRNQTGTVRAETGVSGNEQPDYIFTDEKGLPIPPRKMSMAFRERIPRAAERNLRMHDLRITNATMEYRLTGDLARVQKNLGHSSPDVTVNYYIDPDPKHSADTARAIDEYYAFLEPDERTDEKERSNASKYSV